MRPWNTFPFSIRGPSKAGDVPCPRPLQGYHGSGAIATVRRSVPVEGPRAELGLDAWPGAAYGDAMDETDPILLEIDRLIRSSRLKEIEFIMGTDRAERVREIRGALRRLAPGSYLLGTGPATVGIIPLDGREVVLGRRPTVLEDPGASPPSYSASDTLYFVPREVSRAHARVTTELVGDDPQHILVDLHSTCGTFVNDDQVDPDGIGVILKHGDVVSLGPSRTSTYVYYDAD